MKYPKGALNQHKRLATGQPLEKCNDSDKGGRFGSGQPVPGKIHKSGDTGSGGDTSGPPKARVDPW